MKTYKHKSNGSTMTYKDGCMRIENLVVEGHPNLEFWEEVVEDNNPLKLELGKTYKIRYKFCMSSIKICKVDRFTQNGYPWSNSLGGAITDSYELIEEVVEKDYEILSFYCNDKIFSKLHPKSSKSFPYWSKDTTWVSYNNGNCKIHSIKRKSDGEVFTIGDKAITKYGNYGNITEFELKYNKIYITTKSGENRCYLDDLKPIKKPFNKDYEVLSFYAKNISGKGDGFVDPDYIWYETSEGSGKWSRQGYFTSPYSTQEIINHNRYGIHSVRRKSDGEVFTVGDECNPIGKYSYNRGTIDKIEFCEAGYLRLASKNWYMNIDGIEHSKKPIFKTEDGIDIFEGDKFWAANINRFIVKEKFACVNCTIKLWENKKWIIYSTKEAAEEYILYNKPRFSLKDVFSVYPEFKKCEKERTKHAEELIHIARKNEIL